ncbi:MAG: DUF1365 domain-containing protein [Actinomycetota bacterium]|nr:DUF1365 domain-containing protein [Actinomycetota bacterium]
MSASAVYEGVMRHRRFTPVEHSFEYRVFMPLLDLGELPALFDGNPLWSARGRAVAQFRRDDYLGDPATPLDESVRELVAERTGRRPKGPVRVLAGVRTLGYLFNPVSFYYCYGAERGPGPAGERVDAVVAEVTNTPWGDQHSYVLDRGDAVGGVMRAHADKRLHVSPFHDMDQSYSWNVTEPGEQLQVHIENRREGELLFDATLSMKRRELTPAALGRVLMRYPVMPLAVSARIYLNALKLRLKGVPWHANPAR